MSGAVEGVAVNTGNSDLFRNETTARAKAFVEAMAIVNRDPFVALGILTTPPARSYADGVDFRALLIEAGRNAGAYIDDRASDEFLKCIPEEVRLKILSQGGKA